MTNANKTRDIYITGLRNQHAVEQQAVETLERQINRLDGYPEMAARLREHIAESKQQAARLEQLLSGLGSSPSAVKDAVTSVVGNVTAAIHMPASDEVLKNTLANVAFEHYEIASYTALLALAEAAGHADAQPVLQASLREEQQMAQWLEAQVAPTFLAFAQRAEAEQTAAA